MAVWTSTGASCSCRAVIAAVLLTLLLCTPTSAVRSLESEGLFGDVQYSAGSLPEAVTLAAKLPPSPPQPPAYGDDQPTPTAEEVMADPMNCSGFVQPRIYLEGQAWFTPDAADISNSIQLHVGACMPHRQWVAGTIRLAVLVRRQAYNLPDSRPVNLKAGLVWTGQKGTVTRLERSSITKTGNWNCSSNSSNNTSSSSSRPEPPRICQQVLFVDLPTVSAALKVADGLTSLTLFAWTTINSTNSVRTIAAVVQSWLVVQNQPDLPYPVGLTKPLGTKTSISSSFPWSWMHLKFQSDVPLEPLVGNWSFNAAGLSSALTANITGLNIAVDPDFSASPVVPGYVIRSYDAADLPNKDCPVTAANTDNAHVECKNVTKLQLDTTVLNDTTWHRLMIRVDSNISQDNPVFAAYNAAKASNAQAAGGTLSSVYMVPFRTNNTGSAVNGAQDVAGGDNQTSTVQRPPAGFNPPAGVVAFNGSQELPDINATLNIAAAQYNCSGWLENRMWQQGGTWLTRASDVVGDNSTRLSVGACLPYAQKVAGKVPFDLLIQKHNWPAGFGSKVWLYVTFTWQGGNITFTLQQGLTTANWSCSTPTDCRAVVSIWVDTKPVSGDWVVPDGLNSVTLQASIDYADPSITSRKRNIAGWIRSWVVVTNNADLDVSSGSLNVSASTSVGYPWGPGPVTVLLAPRLPTTPVAGNWTFSTKHMSNAYVNVSQMLVAVDPVFAASGQQGFQISNATAADPAMCTANRARRIDCGGVFTLDTTRLCNGIHRLFLRTDTFAAPNSDPVIAKYGSGTLSAAAALAFQVANPVESVGCQAAPTSQAAAAATADAAVLGSAARPTGVRGRAVGLSPADVVLPAHPRTVQDVVVVSYFHK